MLRIVAMFLGIGLAVIHLLVGTMNIAIYSDGYTLGILFLIGAFGYLVAGFATAFNRIKFGMVVFIIFLFLDFFIMLNFDLILQFFSCLLAITCVFLIIVQIRQDYFAMESTKDEEEHGKRRDNRSIVKGSTPDPLGFDQDVYYRKYHNIKLKKKKGSAGKKKEEDVEEEIPSKEEPKEEQKNETKDENDDRISLVLFL